jgi:hypothetical protein
MCPSNFCVRNGSRSRRWRSIRWGPKQARSNTRFLFGRPAAEQLRQSNRGPTGRSQRIAIRMATGWDHGGENIPRRGRAVHQLLSPGHPTCYQPRILRTCAIVSSFSRFPGIVDQQHPPSAQHCWNDFAKPCRTDELREAHEDRAASRILFAGTLELADHQLFHSPILTPESLRLASLPKSVVTPPCPSDQDHRNGEGDLSTHDSWQPYKH